MVRFYLGKDTLEKYYGDDWNDTPYECNAGTVYDEYISGTADLVFPFDALVLEPCSGAFNSRYCKDDMRAGVVPCIIVVPPDLAKDSYQTEFDYWAACKGIHKFYMNDQMAPTTEPALYCFDPKERLFRQKKYTFFVTKQDDATTTPGDDSMKEIPIWEKAIHIDKETAHNELDTLFVLPNVHSKGIGYGAWLAIEALHPETKVWKTCTPYFDKRNIHFYVNKCGFQIDEFWCEYFKPSEPMPDEMPVDEGPDEMFHFVKVMK